MIQTWDTVRDNAYSHELLLSILIELSDQVAILTRNLSSMLFTSRLFSSESPGRFLQMSLCSSPHITHPVSVQLFSQKLFAEM